MGDFELFPDEEEEEEAVAEEGANRTFFILVAVLGGLFLVGVCAFVAWALFINPRMRTSIEATNVAILAAAEATTETPLATTEAPPESTEPPAPTGTPQPAQTEASTEAPEATPAEETEEPTVTPAETAERPTAAPEEVAEAPTATPRPTATRRPTATPRSGNNEVPGTGVGVLGASALAVGLVFLLAIVRRMRRAV